MTFHLEPITSVSPDLPAPSYETVPCPRLRNGKTCNEPLHFETDGLGRLVELCPVCDWGWRPSRQYDAFEKRAAVAKNIRRALGMLYAPQIRSAREAPRQPLGVCGACGNTFEPPRRGGNTKYCSAACGREAVNGRRKARRDAMASARRCVVCEKPNDRKGRSCSACAERVKRAAAARAARPVAQSRQQMAQRAFWQNKQLRGAA